MNTPTASQEHLSVTKQVKRIEVPVMIHVKVHCPASAVRTKGQTTTRIKLAKPEVIDPGRYIVLVYVSGQEPEIDSVRLVNAGSVVAVVQDSDSLGVEDVGAQRRPRAKRWRSQTTYTYDSSPAMYSASSTVGAG